jgi:hypothetical protein
MYVFIYIYIFIYFLGYKNKKVPMITVVKCGNTNEQNQPKPGNRGKRDSQLILMNFFSRVAYNDRMSALDYDLFRKITHLMNVTPDFFEVVLMVNKGLNTAILISINSINSFFFVYFIYLFIYFR